MEEIAFYSIVFGIPVMVGLVLVLLATGMAVPITVLAMRRWPALNKRQVRLLASGLIPILLLTLTFITFLHVGSDDYRDSDRLGLITIWIVTLFMLTFGWFTTSCLTQWIVCRLGLEP